MRLLALLLSFGLVFAMSTSVEASAPKKVAVKASKKTVTKTVAKTTAKKKGASGELQTDVKFDDSVLHGQYQTPDEALAKVENEKGLADLLGVRKHFKDRLSVAAGQE
jgi:hypothetical protein